MIEAVNSAIASAQVLRSYSERGGALGSGQSGFSVNDIASAPQAPYVSPYIAVDTNFHKAVLVLRDSSTGDVVEQIPSESSLETRARERAREEDARQVQTLQRDGAFVPASTAEGADVAVVGVDADITVVGDTSSSVNPQVNVAIAAFSAGAQTGQPHKSTMSVTA